MSGKGPEVLHYADPGLEPPNPRKDTIALFREPPGIAQWSRSDWIIWIVSFAVVLAALAAGALWLLSDLR